MVALMQRFNSCWMLIGFLTGLFATAASKDAYANFCLVDLLGLCRIAV